MPYAVEVFFDAVSDYQIRSAWIKLAETSGSRYLLEVGAVPHIAVGVVDGDAERVFEGWRRFVQNLPTQETIRHSKLGVFRNGVCFASFERKGVLLELNQRFEEIFASPSLHLLDYYLAGNWVPHCTLAQGVAVEKMDLVVQAAESIELPLGWAIEVVALVEFAPTKILDSRSLLS